MSAEQAYAAATAASSKRASEGHCGPASRSLRACRNSRGGPLAPRTAPETPPEDRHPDGREHSNAGFTTAAAFDTRIIGVAADFGGAPAPAWPHDLVLLAEHGPSRLHTPSGRRFIAMAHPITALMR